VDALGVNAILFVKCRHLADGALDIIGFVPRRIVKERDRAGVQGNSGL
jgi:hypothetical protein